MDILVVMGSSFRSEGQGSIADAEKDSLSACGVRPRKFRYSESPVVGHQLYATGEASGENFPFFQSNIEILEVEMDGAAICRSKAEIGLLLMQNRPPFL